MYSDAIMILSIIAVSISIALAIRYLIIGKKAYQINRLLLIVCAIALPIGSYLIIFQSTVLLTHIESMEFPSVVGVVVKSEIVGSERAFRPSVTYEYQIDSVKYSKTTSMQSPMFGNKRKQHDVARVTTELYHVGKEVEVLYNPDDPSEANLPHSLAWNVYGQIGFGAVLLMISIVGLLFPRKKSFL